MEKIEQEVEKLIYEATHNRGKSNEDILNICNKITEILPKCPEHLKEKLLQNCDYIFMLKNAIIEEQK